MLSMATEKTTLILLYLAAHKSMNGISATYLPGVDTFNRGKLGAGIWRSENTKEPIKYASSVAAVPKGSDSDLNL